MPAPYCGPTYQVCSATMRSPSAGPNQFWLSTVKVLSDVETATTTPGMADGTKGRGAVLEANDVAHGG